MTEIQSVPNSTYRVQLTPEFTFSRLKQIIPYLKELGISHIYVSPIFQAQTGSTHGYDIVDHNKVNSELGGEPAFIELSEALHSNQMGLIVDFVPNHMGIAGALNWRWREVLEDGRFSRFSSFFDVDWKPRKDHLIDRVLIPVLHDFYGRVLSQGDLQLKYQEGTLLLDYRGNLFPLRIESHVEILNRVSGLISDQDLKAQLTALTRSFRKLSTPKRSGSPWLVEKRRKNIEKAKSRLKGLSEKPEISAAISKILTEINGVKGKPETFDLLHEILEQQNYFLSFWKTGAYEINYRRFFTVDSLIGIRMELDEVFDATHALVLRLVSERRVQGLRIDHIDGLWNPLKYLARLSSAVAEIRPIYIVVEKILSPREKLPSWPIQGTTGYEFASDLCDLLTDHSSEQAFNMLYQQFTGIDSSAQDVIRRTKLEILDRLFPTVVDSLTDSLESIVKSDREWRDLTRAGLRRVICETIACLSVYRTYKQRGQPPSEADQQVIRHTISTALQNNQALDPTPFRFFESLWLGQYPDEKGDPSRRDEVERWVNKFQQATGAIMAKSVEDTLFYRYVRLFGLNEVGHDPFQFGRPPSRFHESNLHRVQSWPATMLASSTHDTKTSEDVRARLLCLPEISQDWREAIFEWRSLNRGYKSIVDGREAPDPNEEYLIYQIIVGSWPLGQQMPDAIFVGRIKGFFRKAACEAKRNSSWVNPHELWHKAGEFFLESILDPNKPNFLPHLTSFIPKLMKRGMEKALTQTVLKLTSPGVPDIYQGNEIWDFSLVDPDNRRPVDFDLRRQCLEQVKNTLVSIEDLFKNWEDGRIKLYLIWKLLGLRNQLGTLFHHGDYVSLELQGDQSQNFIAFSRSDGVHLMIVVAAIRDVSDSKLDQTWVHISPQMASCREILSGVALRPADGKLCLAEVLPLLPVAVLINDIQGTP